jgi:hypothetical protein
MSSASSFARPWMFWNYIVVIFVILIITSKTDAFTVMLRNHCHYRDDISFSSSMMHLYSTTTQRSTYSTTTPTIFSGEVTQESTKRLNHYNIITQSTVYTPGSGRAVPMKDLLFSSSLSSSTSTTMNNTNIVVFLRSLG